MQSSVVQATHVLGLVRRAESTLLAGHGGRGEAGEDLSEKICGSQASQQQLDPSAEGG